MQTLNRFAIISGSDLYDKIKNQGDVYLVENTNAFALLSPGDVIAVEISKLQTLANLTELRKKFKKIIVLAEDHDQLVVYSLGDSLPDLIQSEDLFSFNDFLNLAEQIDQENQDQIYLNLTVELNQEYENIKKELENKLSDNQQELIESRQKIFESNNKSESLRKILFAIHQEDDIHRMETILNDLVPAASTATWVKIVEKEKIENFESDLKLQLGCTYHSSTLNNYRLYFIKGDEKKFKKSEVDLFLKIFDALNLNVERIENINGLQIAENVMSTAFSTFNRPLALINESYNVINSNAAFNRSVTTSTSQPAKCYELLFGKNEPCQNCKLGTHFSVATENETFDVQSSTFSSNSDENKMWLNLYKDRTEEILLEQKITENAKLNDLGVISSSIAHELNNPLGGILSYLQILQMELPKDHVVQTDLTDMVSTSLKMKKTIEDLLIFSRRQNLEDKAEVQLKDIIQEALSINDLIFKTENIKVSNQTENTNYKINISKTAFRDSLFFIFNFFIEKSKAIRKNKPRFTGLLEVKLIQDQIKTYLEIGGNFGPVELHEKSKDVYFLTLHKTLMDQGFQVKLTEQGQTWVAIQVIVQKS